MDTRETYLQLAVRLGVSKGGFYWHFADRKALEETLEAWEKAVVEDVIAHVESQPGEPRAKLQRLSSLLRRRVDLASNLQYATGRAETATLLNDHTRSPTDVWTISALCSGSSVSMTTTSRSEAPSPSRCSSGATSSPRNTVTKHGHK